MFDCCRARIQSAELPCIMSMFEHAPSSWAMQRLGDAIKSLQPHPFLILVTVGSQSDKKKSAVAIDCSICLESMEPDQGYSLTTCGHLFCKSCLHEYVQSKVSGKEVRLLTCPNTKCRVSLDPIDVRASTLELGDAICWQSYQEVATESFLDTAVASKDASIRRCPTNHCNFTFQYEGSDGNENGQLFICPHVLRGVLSPVSSRSRQSRTSS